MLKLIVKLAVAGLIANAAWRLGSAYLQYYQFTDAITQVAQFGSENSRAELERRVLELAEEYDVPLMQDAFTVRRDDRSHTFVDGTYTKPVDLAPGYTYPWPFQLQIDVFTLKPPKREPGP